MSFQAVSYSSVLWKSTEIQMSVQTGTLRQPQACERQTSLQMFCMFPQCVYFCAVTSCLSKLGALERFYKTGVKLADIGIICTDS